jgi:hypothetical protein
MQMVITATWQGGNPTGAHILLSFHNINMLSQTKILSAEKKAYNNTHTT